MIWFNIKKLEEDISNDNLSEKDGFNYVLAYVLASFILSTILAVVRFNEMSGGLRLLGTALYGIITIWGLKAIYKINLEIDGKDIVKRFFAINWVIGMRVLVALLILALIGGIAMGILSTNRSNLESNPMAGYILVIFTSLVTIILYLLIMKSFRKLKPKTE